MDNFNESLFVLVVICAIPINVNFFAITFLFLALIQRTHMHVYICINIFTNNGSCLYIMICTNVATLELHLYVHMYNVIFLQCHMEGKKMIE